MGPPRAELEDAKERATLVIENITPGTVIIDPAIVPSSPVRLPARLGTSIRRRATGAVARSMVTVSKDSPRAAAVRTAGRNQKLLRAAFQKSLSRVPETPTQ